MIEAVKEVLDKVYLKPDPDLASGCGFTDADLRDAPVVELEPE